VKRPLFKGSVLLLIHKKFLTFVFSYLKDYYCLSVVPVVPVVSISATFLPSCVLLLLPIFTFFPSTVSNYPFPYISKFVLCAVTQRRFAMFLIVCNQLSKTHRQSSAPPFSSIVEKIIHAQCCYSRMSFSLCDLLSQREIEFLNDISQ
jgi:hypothetical protein